LLVFGVLPGLYALLITFADFRGGSPQFFAAGLHNYRIALTDFRLLNSFIHIGKYLAISTPLVIGVSLLLVLLLHARPGKLSSALRTIYFVPGAVAGPTAVLLAIFMFDPNVSPFRGLLHAAGYELISDVIRLSNLATLFAILTLFLGAGGWIAILYGALNNISTEVLEAAAIDGCSMWQLAWYIKLPLIFPYIIYMLILVFAGNVQLFAEPQLISAATPAVITRYWSPNQLAYALAFESANFGAAAVVSLLMVLIGLVGAVLILSTTNIFRPR
jgi:multiple sugar transport system permease protein